MNGDGIMNYNTYATGGHEFKKFLSLAYPDYKKVKYMLAFR